MPEGKIIQFPVARPAPAWPAPAPSALGPGELRRRGVRGAAVLQQLALGLHEREGRRHDRRRRSARLDGPVRAATRASVRESTLVLLVLLGVLLDELRDHPARRSDVVWCLAEAGLTPADLGVATLPVEVARTLGRAELERLVDRIWEAVPSMRDAARA